MAEAQLTGCILPPYEQTGRQPVQAQFVGHLGRDCVFFLLSTEQKRQPVNEHQAMTALATDKQCHSLLCFQKHLAGQALEYIELCVLKRSLEEQRMFRGYDLAVYYYES